MTNTGTFESEDLIETLEGLLHEMMCESNTEDDTSIFFNNSKEAMEIVKTLQALI